MKLQHGMRFVLVDRGEIWELKKRTLMGHWLCLPSGPSCGNDECPSMLFKEFSEDEIWENAILDSTNHAGKWMGQMEVEIIAALNSRLKNLTAQQKTSMLRAIRDHIDQRLDPIPDDGL